MWDEFQTLLDSDRVDGKLLFYNKLALMQILDLARMYGLLSRVLNGLDPLREKFGQHVRRAGRAAVEKVLPAPGAVNEAGKAESLVSAPRCWNIDTINCLSRIPRHTLRPSSKYTASILPWSKAPSEAKWVSTVLSIRPVATSATPMLLVPSLQSPPSCWLATVIYC